ncbi:hypothetical protein IAD21_03339 [Abditibacteriota bacterium]|nr:hypothetical protein IAD21_03339 [Abditibacteriota bacterium]
MKCSRVLWLVGVLILPLSFGLFLTLAALNDQRVRFQFDWDGTRRSLDEGLIIALIFGIPFEFGLSLILTSLTWIVWVRPGRFWRPFVFCTSSLGTSALLFFLRQYWHYNDIAFHPLKAYPVDVKNVLFFGIPLLWTLSLLFFSITTRSTPHPILEAIDS